MAEAARYGCEAQMIRKLKLQLFGALRERFGPEYELVAKTPAEGIHALCALVPGFRQYLLDNSEPGFHIITDRDIGEESLHDLCPSDTVQIVPVIVGASSGFRVVFGVVLMVAALAIAGFSFGALSGFSAVLFNVGLGMAIGGVSEMLMKKPTFSPSTLDKGPADTPSYSFQGPHMTTGQGNCVPIGYGRLRIGGALISVGIKPETWPTKGFGGAAVDEDGTTSGDGDTTPWVWAVAPVQG